MNTINIEFQKWVCQIAKDFSASGNAGMADVSAAPKVGVEYGISFVDTNMYITFKEPVSPMKGESGKRFKVYPISKRKPSGELSAIR